FCRSLTPVACVPIASSSLFNHPSSSEIYILSYTTLFRSFSIFSCIFAEPMPTSLNSLFFSAIFFSLLQAYTWINYTCCNICDQNSYNQHHCINNSSYNYNGIIFIRNIRFKYLTNSLHCENL